jgi:hypothetical protein
LYIAPCSGVTVSDLDRGALALPPRARSRSAPAFGKRLVGDRRAPVRGEHLHRGAVHVGGDRDPTVDEGTGASSSEANDGWKRGRPRVAAVDEQAAGCRVVPDARRGLAVGEHADPDRVGIARREHGVDAHHVAGDGQRLGARCDGPRAMRVGEVALLELRELGHDPLREPGPLRRRDERGTSRGSAIALRHVPVGMSLA